MLHTLGTVRPGLNRFFSVASAHAAAVETCVPAANTDGLRFARLRGFEETDRYTLDGDPAVWVDLRLRPSGSGN
ncbi:hypothetical protein SGPA1_50743 [Streptomyces misionensis JCM 4497]